MAVETMLDMHHRSRTAIRHAVGGGAPAIRNEDWQSGQVYLRYDLGRSDGEAKRRAPVTSDGLRVLIVFVDPPLARIRLHRRIRREP